jgi:hypothetical protein
VFARRIASANYDVRIMSGNLKVEADASDPAPADIELWLATPEAAAAFRADALGSTDRTRYERIRSERRRRDFQVSRALLQGLNNEAPAPPPLSHSGGYACTARIKASAGSDVAFGFDLEAHRTREELTLARLAFTQDEAESIEEGTAAERERRFYALWTLKEAVARALRLPLLDALRECVFVQRAGEWRVRIPTDAPCSLTVFEPRPALTLAVALIGRPGPLSMRLQEWPSGAEVRWPVVAQVSRDSRGGRGGLYPPEGAGAGARAPRATGP